MNTILFSFLFFPLLQQQEQNRTPWWGWILAALALAGFIWLIVDNFRLEKEQEALDSAARAAAAHIDEEEALATQISGLHLEHTAEELLAEKGRLESVDVIETDLDGIPGPEIVQVVEKVVAEDEGLKVTKTTETVSSLIDGIATEGVSEILVADTEDLDITRVSQKVSTEGEGIDLEESIETFTVDSTGLDISETVESSFDELQDAGVVDVTRTVVDEQQGIGVIDTSHAVLEPLDEIVEADLEQAAEAADEIPQKAQEIDWSSKGAEVFPDDLTLVEGIGPKINSIMHAAGVHTFADMAALDADKLKEIITTAGLRLADTTTWPMQAKLAAEGKLEELKAFQDSLKGGRLA